MPAVDAAAAEAAVVPPQAICSSTALWTSPAAPWYINAAGVSVWWGPRMVANGLA